MILRHFILCLFGIETSGRIGHVETVVTLCPGLFCGVNLVHRQACETGFIQCPAQTLSISPPETRALPVFYIVFLWCMKVWVFLFYAIMYALV